MKRLALILTAVASISLLTAAYYSTETNSAPVEMLGEAEEGGIQWMTWNEVDKAMKDNPKKVFVDVYTCWCGPCRMFSNTTLKDPRIVAYLNKNYYSIKFDAHHPDDITIGGKTYSNPKYVDYGRCQRNGTHELAYAVATTEDGRLAFPTTVYFDENFNKLSVVPGMQKANVLEQILTYYNGDYHQKIDWKQFQQDFAQYKEEI